MQKIRGIVLVYALYSGPSCSVLTHRAYYFELRPSRLGLQWPEFGCIFRVLALAVLSLLSDQTTDSSWIP